MPLIQTDLIRSFAVGFALGAVGLVAVMGSSGDEGGTGLVPQAIAAPVAGAAAPAGN